jgi:hypothetical protein
MPIPEPTPDDLALDLEAYHLDNWPGTQGSILSRVIRRCAQTERELDHERRAREWADAKCDQAIAELREIRSRIESSAPNEG